MARKMKTMDGNQAAAFSKSGEKFIIIYVCLSPADDYESRMKHE